MGGDAMAAMHDTARLKWWPTRDQTRAEEELAARRAERAARARRKTKGQPHEHR